MSTSDHSRSKRGLGRGLGALFEDEESSYAAAAPEAGESADAGTARRTLGVDLLQPGIYQPRQDMDAEDLGELASSIAVHGVLQPLLVRPLPDKPGRYEIIAGERRWRAAQKAQLHEVPVIIREMEDEQVLEVALIENLQRADLNALEEALGFQRLMSEFGHTQEKLAVALGKSRSHVANTLRLLSLPPGVQALLRQGRLSAGHARALITAEQPDVLARQVVERGLSVRDTEKLAAAAAATEKKKKSGVGPIPKDVDTVALEKEMTAKLGLNVTIDMKGDGKGGRTGALKVDFKNLDQLDDVLRRLSR